MGPCLDSMVLQPLGLEAEFALIVSSLGFTPAPGTAGILHQCGAEVPCRLEETSGKYKNRLF